jgi:2-C-methyl-D-erythritol 4-phosphate cytidylyltransferase
MMFHAVVPAAGIGKRMASTIPKQYLSLLGRRVIDWSVDALLRQSDISSVTVALSADDGYWQDTRSASNPLVTTVTGGAERCDSVLNALEILLPDADDDTWVLVHDAARPCLRVEELSRLLSVAGKGQGGLLGVPVYDTMKRTDARENVLQTVDRNHLWHAQTPQMFPLKLLHEAIQAALDAGVAVTDEASAMEWAGYTPVMVEGVPGNIKITRPEDLQLAAFYLTETAPA